MNLLHIVHYPVFGGPHNQALRLAKPLMRHGWRTTVLLPDEKGNARERLAAAGLDVITTPLGRLRATSSPATQASYAFRLPTDVGNIRRVIRERGIDLVLLAGHVNVQGAIAARLERVPVVWQVLDTRTPAFVDEFTLHASRSLADAVMTTGHSLAARHRGRLGTRQQIFPFYPPVDCSEFKPLAGQRDEVRRGWDVAADAFVLGTVANINPQKGIDQLIDALARVREYCDARLVVVGAEHETHKAYRAGLTSRLLSHGMVEGKDVIFTGGRADVARQMLGFDIFVMGSVPNSEGVPTVILEAMSCALPVVATDVGGVGEAVEHGVTGLVVPPLQPHALAEATLRLIRDPQLRDRMSAAARENALRKFDVEACALRHVEAFASAVARRLQRPDTEISAAA
jgi:glycosyltransferase involved in cell wall biosynthesis